MGSSAILENGDRQIRQHLLVDDVESGTANSVTRGPPHPKLSIRGLTRMAPDTGEPILSDVTVDIPRGLVVGVIGPSGSGKSTLLRAVNRLWEPPKGTVFLDGVDICDLEVLALRRRVGMLFQLPALFEGTVADNVRYGPSLRGKKLTDAEVSQLLVQADLEPSLATRAASDLSVGQAQRVALARTLANEPEVLLLDEPTSALDPISTQNIEEALLRLKTSRGITAIMVTHSVKQIQRVADVVCLIVDGQLVEVLEPQRIGEARHPTARRFLELSS